MKECEDLIKHLEDVEARFSESLKIAYMCGFADARDPDYLGCDSFARWESSEVKGEIEKNK